MVEDHILDKAAGVAGKGEGDPVPDTRIHGINLETGPGADLGRVRKFQERGKKITLHEGRPVIFDLVLGDAEIVLQLRDAGEIAYVGEKINGQILQGQRIPDLIAGNDIPVNDIFKVTPMPGAGTTKDENRGGCNNC